MAVGERGRKKPVLADRPVDTDDAPSPRFKASSAVVFARWRVTAPQARRKADPALAPKISKTTPCKVACQSPACAIPRKDFDTSGKSPAMFHHRATGQTPMTPRDTGFAASCEFDRQGLTIHGDPPKALSEKAVRSADCSRRSHPPFR